MIEALEPLSALPGVTLAMLVTKEGIPISVSRGKGHASDEDSDTRLDTAAIGRDDALAALAVGWSNELKNATAPLSWDTPKRVVLRCARGAIVMRSMRGAVLLLVLARGASPEDVRLPMDGTVKRIERSLRGSDGAEEAFSPKPDLPGPIPSSHTDALADGSSATSNASRREGLSGN